MNCGQWLSIIQCMFEFTVKLMHILVFLRSIRDLGFFIKLCLDLNYPAWVYPSLFTGINDVVLLLLEMLKLLLSCSLLLFTLFMLLMA